VKEPQDGIILVVSLHEEEAVHGVEDDATQQRIPNPGKYSRREIEEALLTIGRVKTVALGEHHPPTRVEARINDATSFRANRAGPPMRTHGAEADVVEQVSGQHPPADQENQIHGERTPL
jgi:hypothetical protein